MRGLRTASHPHSVSAQPETRVPGNPRTPQGRGGHSHRQPLPAQGSTAKPPHPGREPQAEQAGVGGKAQRRLGAGPGPDREGGLCKGRKSRSSAGGAGTKPPPRPGYTPPWRTGGRGGARMVSACTAPTPPPLPGAWGHSGPTGTSSQPPGEGEAVQEAGCRGLHAHAGPLVAHPRARARTLHGSTGSRAQRHSGPAPGPSQVHVCAGTVHTQTQVQRRVSQCWDTHEQPNMRV